MSKDSKERGEEWNGEKGKRAPLKPSENCFEFAYQWLTIEMSYGF